MKVIIIFLMPFLCLAQRKEALIDSVLAASSNSWTSPTPQHIRFEELKSTLTPEEFALLANHDNGTIRMYTCYDLIASGKGDPFVMFKNELERNESIDHSAGCTPFYEYTSNIIYEDFWGEIQYKAKDTIMDYLPVKPLKRMSKRAGNNLIMQKMDSLAIFTLKHVSFRTYHYTFSNKKFGKEFLPRIEQLAFSENNAYAMEYLLDHYPRRYRKKAEAYFSGPFQTTSFKSEEEMYYYHYFTEMLLKTGKPEMQDLALAKLKSDDPGIYKSWFNQLLAEYNLPVLPKEVSEEEQ